MLAGLRDRVDIVEGREYTDGHGNTRIDWDDPELVATVAAHVGYMSATVKIDSGTGQFGMLGKLTAVIDRGEFDTKKQRIRWRGDLYQNDGPAMRHTAGRRVHHLSIPLREFNP